MGTKSAAAVPRLRSAWAVTLSAAVCTILAFAAATSLERQRIALEFRETSTAVSSRLQRELQVVINDLYGVSALFDLLPDVDRDGFEKFVRPLLDRHPELAAIEWAPRIPAASVGDYARRARADRLEFRLVEQAQTGQVSPAAPRDEYFPVYYVVPWAGNETAFGLDLAASPDRSTALVAARDEGRAAIAGPLHLVQSPTDVSGYLVMLPVYAAAGSGSLDVARRQSFRGVVVGVLRLSDALATVLSARPVGDMVVAVFDESRPIVYRGGDGSQVPAGSPRNRGFSSDTQLVFVDRPLVVRTWSKPGFFTKRKTVIPTVVGAGGGVLSIVLALYLGSLRRESTARARADEALVESERRYRMLVESAPEAVVVYDADVRKFVDANSKAAALLGLSHDQLLALSPGDLAPRLQPDGRESAARTEELIERTLAGEDLVVPWNARHVDGREIPVELRLNRLPDTSRRLVRTSVIDVRDRRQAELRQLMMARELDHRVKNTLATVLSIADRTSAGARSIEEFRESFVGRVRALAHTHEALAAGRWDGVALGEVLDLALDPFIDPAGGRATFSGQPVRLSPAASSGLGMAFHELAANAAKYGALSGLTGKVHLAWAPNGDGSLVVDWKEREGPRVVSPATVGFGSRLIEGVLSHELGGHATLEYEPDGVRCRMTIPAEHWTVDEAVT